MSLPSVLEIVSELMQCYLFYQALCDFNPHQKSVIFQKLRHLNKSIFSPLCLKHPNQQRYERVFTWLFDCLRM